MPTIFTRIIDGEIPGTFIWRDDRCVAFLSINPLAHGHVLVVPIAEVDHWIDLPAGDVAHLIEVSHVIGHAQQAAFAPERIGLIIAGYEVPHVHVHVIPTTSMADLSFANAAASVEPGGAGVGRRGLRAELRAARSHRGRRTGRRVRSATRLAAASARAALAPLASLGLSGGASSIEVLAPVADVVHVGRHRCASSAGCSAPARAGRPARRGPGWPGRARSSHAVGGRITGIRSWTGAIVSLAAVVMIVHECSLGASAPGFGSRHVSHSPAKASGSPSRRWMK